jgi:hypothetical protein
MKLKTVDEQGEYVLDPKGRNVMKEVLWGDHFPACVQCREVNLGASSSFVHACGEGAALLMEELAKRQAPIVAQKNKEVRDWARKAGVFKGVK